MTTSVETGWSQTGSLAADRLLHTATRLQDGRVLVVGGYNPSVELYDPATGTWSATANAPGNYRGATATLLASGKVLVAGAPASGISAALYDPASSTWAATGGLAMPRYHHTATLLPDGRVLVAGGADQESGGNALASAELYDPATETWTAAGALSTARSHHTATLLPSGQVLVTGGEDAAGLLASAELYEPASGAWTAAAAMGTARAIHTATLLPSGQVLVTGGGLDGAPAASAELYDPATRSWSAASSMSQPRRRHTATLLPSGKVLAAGGYDGSTGIQGGAELYDPDRDTWDAMAPMAEARYQHTATLLQNGRVLVAGGTSTGNQASAELFSAAYVQVVLESGAGWQLVNVSSASMDAEGQPFNANLYMVSDELGVASAPLPDGLREELADEAAAEEAMYFLDQKLLDEIRIAQQTGALTPALEAVAEPLDGSTAGFLAQGVFSGCADKPATLSKTVDFLSYLSFSKDLGEGFSGRLSTSGNLHANATAELHLAIKRFGLFGKCIPYGVGFDYFRAHGGAGLDYGASLNGTLDYARSWEFDVAKPHLASVVFTAGPVPVHIGFNLPITVGLDLQANVGGSLSYTAQQSTAIGFDATCRLDGCEASTSFSAPSFRDVEIQGNITGRIQPSVWAQAGLRMFLYEENIAYAQVGVRPYVHGDLWGFTGSNCGDADGDGVEELVQAGTLNLDWRLSLTGQASALARNPAKYNDIWTSPRWLIGFWDLTQNGSTALEPMLVGPSTTGQHAITAYELRMRPCWPYSDAMTYQLDWGDGTIETLGAGLQSTITARHAWAQAGNKPVRVVAVRDAHGRNIGRTFARTIQVAPQPPPEVPAEHFRQVRITGRLDLLDDEIFGPDPRKTLWIDDVADLEPASPTAAFHYSDCVGNEVRAEVDIHLTLQSDNVTVKAQAYGRLFEETSCNNDDLDATAQSEVLAAQDGATQLHFQMLNTELGRPDSATLDITVTNQQRP